MPLSCGDSACRFRYDLGPYTYLSINSVLDHSLQQNSNGFYQYGTTANGGGNGVIIAFNSEAASGGGKPGDLTCRVGMILLRPTPSSPSSMAMVNGSGCNGSGQYIYTSYDEHPGYDYRAAYGTPVKAAASGYVLNIGGERCYKGNIAGTCNSWGYVGIDHQNGYITQYGHLSVIYVTMGSRVVEGMVIGLSGHTAPVALGDHLHFEVYKIVNGQYLVVDPYGWVGVGSDPLYSRTLAPPTKLWR
jgi:murein DD-endopeptidase MepM/ murein hydrolase activator NlpD